MNNESVGIVTVMVGLILVIGAVRGTWKKLWDDVVTGTPSSGGGGSSSGGNGSKDKSLSDCVANSSDPLDYIKCLAQLGYVTSSSSGGNNGVADATHAGTVLPNPV